MAFPDTITFTVNSVAKVLTRVNSGAPYSAEYRLRGSLDEYKFVIRHTSFIDKVTKVNRNRHSGELTHTVYPVSPSVIPTVRKSYTVLEEAVSDDAAVAVQKFDEAFVAFFSAANITKLLNYES